jgi:hypothetical protein
VSDVQQTKFREIVLRIKYSFNRSTEILSCVLNHFILISILDVGAISINRALPFSEFNSSGNSLSKTLNIT